MDPVAAMTAFDALSAAVNALGAALRARPPVAETVAARVGDVQESFDKVVAATGTSRVALSEFMSEVGRSVVSVQKQLDVESEAYNRGAAAIPELGGVAQPTAFRLPKVNASIKFAMSSESSRKVGLLFFSNTETAKSAHQQSIDFEIAAVPAPPEVLRSLRDGRQLLSLVLDADEREELRNEATKLARESGPTNREKDLRSLAALVGAPASAGGASTPQPVESSRVVMARAAHPDPRVGRWIIAIPAGTSDEPDVGVWVMTRAADGGVAWSVLYSRSATTPKSEDEPALFAILSEVTKWQESRVPAFRPL